MKIFAIFVLAVYLSSWAQSPDNFSKLQREYDAHGRLIKERFPNGKSIGISYDELNRVIELSLEEIGTITYQYDDTKLLRVSRVSSAGHNMYTHSYEYDSMGGLLRENLISNLGQIDYEKDLKFLRIVSPYSEETCKFNSRGFLSSHSLNGKIFEYEYDNSDQLISSESENQIFLSEYDQDGNLIKKISPYEKNYLGFDQYGRLSEVITDECKLNYFYDDFDRRIAKKIQWKDSEDTETYVYFGDNEIAIYAIDGSLKQLRVPGLSFDDNFILPISIETQDEIYSTIHDYKGNLSKLINIKSQEVISIPEIDPYGQNLSKISSLTPWIFASKHYDMESHQVYFGGRYYDPELKQWISPDPLGTLQHPNLYLYCLGNPLSYVDPNGKFAISLVSLAWGAGAVFTFPAWGTAALVTVAGAAAGWATYEVIQKVKEGKQRDGTPKSNGAQNAQYEDAVREIERKTGKKLDKRDREKLHDHITGQDYGYHEIVEEGYWLFK